MSAVNLVGVCVQKYTGTLTNAACSGAKLISPAGSILINLSERDAEATLVTTFLATGFLTTGLLTTTVLLTTGFFNTLGITNGEAFGLDMTLIIGFFTTGLALLCFFPFCAVITN
jgi:hypothetical protein